MIHGTQGIDLRQARLLCQMSHVDRLAVLADGLPVILKSAKSLWRGSKRLGKKMSREAAVLQRLANEEVAKILILIDVVRCPKSKVDSRIGPMMRWFYDHLARLIYEEIAMAAPVDVCQLQEYVDSHRKSHELEGYVGEYILPNWHIYLRESQLYADMVTDGNGKLSWNDPVQTRSHASFDIPFSLQLVEAMSMLGIFKLEGLKVTSEIWDTVEFLDAQGRPEAGDLTKKLVQRLLDEELPRKGVTDDHARILFHFWQLPMYNIDFKMMKVPIDQLQKQQRLLAIAELYGMDSY